MPESSTHRWPRGLELAVLAAALLACLLPFATKAYHIDDTLFVWAGQHIQHHPLDCFGFDVLWYTTWQPMSNVTQNPPVTCYYLALAGTLFGWGEVALHVAMLLPAWGLVWGTYRLAERFGIRPLPAALLTLTTPVVLICGSSVMCDLMMLCFWVWTVVVWDRGLREGGAGRLYLAAGLIALTTLTKYFGVCLIPLLGVYSWAVDRAGWRRWAKALGFAVLLLAVYQLAFLARYGEGGLAGAVGYAATVGRRSLGGRLFRLFEGLGFVGGCVGVAAIPTVALLSRRGRFVAVLVTIAAAAIAVTLTTTTIDEAGYAIRDSPFVLGGSRVPSAGVFGQFVLWVAAGAGVLLLTAEELWTRRDPIALLLFLWVFGTAVFAAYVNWALNGRSVLPLVPPVALVLVRRLDRSGVGRWAVPAILAPAAALAVAVTYADVRMADADRTAARRLVAELSPPPGRPLWFQGHWGFQYYIQAAGARPWDFESAAGRAGDLLVIPFNNYLTATPEGIVEQIDTVEVPVCPWAATMAPFVGSGFYACSYDWRPLPFAFAHVGPETFLVYRLAADQRPEPKKK